MITMLLLLLSGATAAFAQEGSRSPESLEGAMGKVTAIDGNSITVETFYSGPKTVTVQRFTSIEVFGQGEGSLEDIAVDTYIGAFSLKDGDNSTIEALFILVFEQDPRDYPRARGKVTAIEGNTLVLENQAGEVTRVSTDENTFVSVNLERDSDLGDVQVGYNAVAIGEGSSTELDGYVVMAFEEGFFQERGLLGEVVSVDTEAGQLVVEAQGNKEGDWTINTTDSTVYRIPGVEDASLADISAGDMVAIRGFEGDSSAKTGTARLIVVIPEEFVEGDKVAGDVTAIDGSTLTIETPQGHTGTIFTDAETIYFQRGNQDAGFDDIEVGTRIVASGERTDDTLNADYIVIQNEERPNRRGNR